MRTPLKSIAKAALSRQLSILLILIIGAIGVQTVTSCSSGSDDGGGGTPAASSSSLKMTISSSSAGSSSSAKLSSSSSVPGSSAGENSSSSLTKSSSSSSATISSSSAQSSSSVPSSSSEASSSSVVPSSSSSVTSSSSNVASSSSVVPSSSSSVATYTITYNANNGSGAPAAQTKNHDVSLTLSASKPARTGYVFTDWNTAADGSGTSYASGASYAANASLTLYAQWTATYTITYNANNGSGAPSAQTKNHDVALTLSSTVPTRTGYTFAGWNTATNGSGTSYASGASYEANASLTLYAQWTANTYTVTYNANNGSGEPSAQTKTHDVSLTLSSIVPTRTNYIFTGWNTVAGGSGTSYAAGASYTANANVTLYAQWIKTVVIGTQTWMAENLNYNASGSKCYNNQESYCNTYGRLYDWSTAMALPSTCNSTSCASQIGAKHRGICPSGWHIPSEADWDALMAAVGGSSKAGTKLKSASGWDTVSGYIPGTDDYGFSALPGGLGHSTGSFSSVGRYGRWWSSPEYGSRNAYYRGMTYSSGNASPDSNDKSDLYSVRCVKD